jgi:asparagine synthase (glutamine-hydrolysing)
MCGIAGIIDFNHKIESGKMPLMLSAIKHRGPDFDAIENYGHVSFAHARLSIIDLSEFANQPFHSIDEQYSIGYNGEIYNYQDIKKQILSIHPKREFKSNSDTEVIIEAYKCFGNEAFNMFNGMFAFCLYDKVKEEVILCRDRIGVKPLFYYFDQEVLYFSSELQAIPKALNYPLQVDSNALLSFLNLGFTPSDNSIYYGIKKLLPGNILKFNKKGAEISSFWTLKSKVKKAISNDYASVRSEVKYLVEDAVALNLISDVPVGVFLSGGMDSSLVAAIAKSKTNDRLNTFSIGFEQSKFNELQHAEKVAKHINSNHHEFVFSAHHAAEFVLEAIDACGEPFADSSVLPTYLVSKLAQPFVKTVLVGDGNDELFMGYGIYNWAERTNKTWVKWSRSLIRQYYKFNLDRGNQRYQYYFEKDVYLNKQQKLFSAEQNFFSQTDLMKNFYLKLQNFEFAKKNNFERNLSPKEIQSLYDITTYLPSDLLVKTDRTSMRHGLEVRVPLLDHRLVELALNINQAFKTKNGIGKSIIKDLLNDYFPTGYFDRPKWGFAVPLADWLMTDLQFLIHDYLNSNVIKRFSIVDWDYVQQLIKRFMDGDTHLDKRLWQLIVLHRWLIKNDVALIR